MALTVTTYILNAAKHAILIAIIGTGGCCLIQGEQMNNFTIGIVGLTRVISRILGIMATVMLINSAAVAQDVFEEIIVTAQKREQNIMDVPIAVSAITGSQIENIPA